MALTREQLTKQVADKTGMPPTEIRELIEAMFNEIGDALARGENVKLSRFASFLVKDKTARIGRNPKTMEEVMISARRTISFKPSPHLADTIGTAHRSRRTN